MVRNLRRQPEIEPRPVPGQMLPRRQAASRRNPFQAPVRALRVRIETGKVICIVTNDLAAPAEEIARLYRRRWAVELFFRWVKQTLKIAHFFGTSENAVRIQMACALIAFLLLRLAQTVRTCIISPLQFARLVRDNLLHQRRIDQLDKPPRTKPILGQATLFQT